MFTPIVALLGLIATTAIALECEEVACLCFAAIATCSYFG
ncbi:hypothetical protein X566_04545 [Afipia sp. P52-10]|nr:hypothetical protein X566_04545 [Afipia sp. P52-10]